VVRLFGGYHDRRQKRRGGRILAISDDFLRALVLYSCGTLRGRVHSSFILLCVAFASFFAHLRHARVIFFFFFFFLPRTTAPRCTFPTYGPVGDITVWFSSSPRDSPSFAVVPARQLRCARHAALRVNASWTTCTSLPSVCARSSAPRAGLVGRFALHCV